MVFEKIRGLLAEQLDIEPEKISESTDIVEDLGADSLDVVELMMALEQEFDLMIADEDVQSFHTVGDVVKYIEQNN